MTDRAQEFMKAVWDCRNNQGADTEEKLVSAILQVAAETVRFYNAQNDLIVLDKQDLLQLAQEIVE
jgi:homogentisate 1,2-dioxygenase